MASAQLETDVRNLVKIIHLNHYSSNEQAHLITLLKPYTYWMARRSFKQLALEDKISSCTFAILKALETYDPTKGMSFISYAVNAMRNELQGLARELIPGYSFDPKNPIEMLSLNLVAEIFELPSNDESIEERMMAKDLDRQLKDAITRFSEREIYIFTHYHGLFEEEEMTLEEIAKELGCTFQNVAKINAKLVAECKEHIEMRWQPKRLD